MFLLACQQGQVAMEYLTRVPDESAKWAWQDLQCAGLRQHVPLVLLHERLRYRYLYGLFHAEWLNVCGGQVINAAKTAVVLHRSPQSARNFRSSG